MKYAIPLFVFLALALSVPVFADSNLMVSYDFTSNLTYALDSSDYNHNGALGNFSVWASSSGIDGGYLNVNQHGTAGDDQGTYFVLGTNTTLFNSKNFTVIMWIKPISTTGRQTLFEIYDPTIEQIYEFGMSRSASGDLFFLIDNGGSFTYSTSNAGLVNTSWQQIAAVWNGVTKNMTLFREGVRIKSDTFAPSTPMSFSASSRFSTGARSQGDGFYIYNGSLDHFRFYNDTKSEDFILSDFNGVMSPPTSLTTPVPTIILPANTTYTSTSRSLQVTANETADKFWYVLNGGSNTTFTPNTTITAVSGTNTLSVFVNGTSGSVQSASVIFTVTLLTTPVPTIILPANTTYLSINRTLQVTANETADKFWYVLNGGANTFFTPNTTITAIAGTNTITVYVNGTSGTTQSTTVVFFTITTPTTPIPSIVSPTNTTYTSTTVNLQVTANETADKWWYVLNGGSNIYFTPDTTITAVSGSNDLTVYVNGTSGSTQSKSVSFTVTLPPPAPPVSQSNFILQLFPIILGIGLLIIAMRMMMHTENMSDFTNAIVIAIIGIVLITVISGLL